jgi:hypothetical protein
MADKMDKQKKRDPYSGRRLISYAVILAVSFLIAHMCGMRQYTNILSGTASYGIPETYFGMVYILLYLCFIVLVPIFLIAYALLKLLSIIIR